MLTSVTGMGPAEARKRYGSGIKTFGDLHNNTHKLNYPQIVESKYAENFAERIPRLEIEQIEIILKKICTRWIPKFKSQFAEADEVSDVDILMSHPSHGTRHESAH